MTVMSVRAGEHRTATDSAQRDGGAIITPSMRFSPLDDPSFSTPTMIDTAWPTLEHAGMEGVYVPEWNGVGWFRASFLVSTRSRWQGLAVRIMQRGASEIYLDGRRIASFGVIGPDGKVEHGYIPVRDVLTLDPHLDRSDSTRVHVLAVRYATTGLMHTNGRVIVPLVVRVGRVMDMARGMTERSTSWHVRTLLPFGMIMCLAVLHLILFIMDRRERINLWYAVFATINSGIFLGWYLQSQTTDPEWFDGLALAVGILWDLIVATALFIISTIFYGAVSRRRMWTILLATSAALLLPWLTDTYGTIIFGAYASLAIIEIGRLSIRGMLQRVEGAWIIGLGLFGFFSYVLLWFIGAFLGLFEIPEESWNAIFTIGVIVMPLSMSVFLARRFTATNRRLEAELRRVEELTEQKVAHERRAIMELNRRQQIEEDNARKTQELEDARRLQLSMVPSTMPLLKNVETVMAMNTATEVGGDYFDYVVHADDHVTMAVGDATGHGLRSGVMVATAKSHFQVHAHRGQHERVLHQTHEGIRRLRLRGLYMCLGLLTIKGDHAQWTSAGIPPILHWKAADGSIDRITVKALPLGSPSWFTPATVHFTVAPRDVLLLCTDGLPELFDRDRRSLGIEAVEQTLRANGHLDARAIMDAVIDLSEDWRGDRPYNDDVTVVVLRIAPDVTAT